MGYFSHIAGRPPKKVVPAKKPDGDGKKDDWTIKAATGSQNKTKPRPRASRKKQDDHADDEGNEPPAPRRASARSTSKEGKDKPPSLPRPAPAKHRKTAGPGTSRAAAAASSDDEVEDDSDQEFGIGRYATEDYKKKTVPINCFLGRRFIQCSSTSESEAKQTVEELAKLVVDDFYKHANRGLVVPHRAEFHYNG
jgi:hypothetical protein